MSVRKAIEEAVLAFQRVEMAHPASDEHSRDMYVTSETARQKLIEALKELPE